LRYSQCFFFFFFFFFYPNIDMLLMIVAEAKRIQVKTNINNSSLNEWRAAHEHDA